MEIYLIQKIYISESGSAFPFTRTSTEKSFQHNVLFSHYTQLTALSQKFTKHS